MSPSGTRAVFVNRISTDPAIVRAAGSRAASTTYARDGSAARAGRAIDSSTPSTQTITGVPPRPRDIDAAIAQRPMADKPTARYARRTRPVRFSTIVCFAIIALLASAPHACADEYSLEPERPLRLRALLDTRIVHGG